jgi:hypothetical protein
MELSQGRLLRAFFLICVGGLTAQISLWAQLHDNPSHGDTCGSLRSRLIRYGLFHAHARSFFMATDNKSPLSDYWAWGLGAGIGYETPEWKGFQLGVTGFFIFNVASSHLGRIDTLSGTGNRYELGLFDIRDPENHHDLDRLENLYLNYRHKKFNIRIGRMEVHTPFLNKQDGRMRGTLEEGIWASLENWKGLSFEGGYIRAISPRSTVDWFKIEKSIGVYPAGLSITGQPSGYPGNLRSRGLFALSAQYSFKDRLRVTIWNLFTENIFNTAFIELEGNIPIGNTWRFLPGFIYTRQDPVNCGGNCDPEKAYMPRGQSSNIFSGRLAFQWKTLNFSFNYTRITAHGRFLFPREWGREYFYTFMQRERNDGLGDVHAAVVRFSYGLFNNRFIPSVGYGHFYVPDVYNYRLNKYGLPSYNQLNAELRYNFKGYLKGFSIIALMVYKGALGETHNEYRFVHNKVDMFNWSFIMDYAF